MLSHFSIVLTVVTICILPGQRSVCVLVSCCRAAARRSMTFYDCLNTCDVGLGDADGAASCSCDCVFIGGSDCADNQYSCFEEDQGD